MEIKGVKCLEFYWFGYLLLQTIEYFGEISNDTYNTDKKVFYHGLDKQMLFDSFTQTFNIPLSVSKNKNIAANFAKQNGIILLLKSTYKYNNMTCNDVYNNNTRFMSVTLLSDFGEFEDECIYFGLNNSLTILDIINQKNKDYGNELYKYIKCIKWFQLFLDNIGLNHKYQYLNFVSKILNRNEQQQLYSMLLCVIHNNNHNLSQEIPEYIYHLFLYFCLKKEKIEFYRLNQYHFILEFKELLSLILMDNYQYHKIFFEENNRYHFPYSNEKLKQIFNNIKKIKDINGKWDEI